MLDLSKLNYEERDTYVKMLKQFESRQLTPEDIKDYLTDMIFTTTEQLAEVSSFNLQQNILLKARLKNYLLFYKVLIRPQKSEEAFKKAMSQLEEKVS